MDVRTGLYRKLRAKELYFWTVLLEKTIENPLDCNEIQTLNPKGNQSWIFFGSTDNEIETLILWPPDAKNQLIGNRPWCWERLKVGGEGDDRGWDGWMTITGWLTSPTLWTWVWVNFRSWWWTGNPGMLQSMGLQRVGPNWMTELNWTKRNLWKWILNVHSSTRDLFSHYCE